MSIINSKGLTNELVTLLVQRKDKIHNFYEFRILNGSGLNTTIPYKAIHFPGLRYEPKMLDEDGWLNIGQTISCRVKRTEDGKTFYYPDHSLYKSYNHVDSNTSTANYMEELTPYLEDYPPYSEELYNRYISKFAIESATMDETKRAEGLRLMGENNKQEIWRYLSSLYSEITLPLVESSDNEFKSSFVNGNGDQVKKRYILTRVLVSAVNARTKLSLWIGVSDKPVEVIGCEKDIVEAGGVEHTETSLRNSFAQISNSSLWLNALHFHFINMKDAHGHNHAVIRIDIDPSQLDCDVLFVGGSTVPLRINAQTRDLKDKDLLDFIRRKSA